MDDISRRNENSTDEGLLTVMGTGEKAKAAARNCANKASIVKEGDRRIMVMIVAVLFKYGSFGMG